MSISGLTCNSSSLRYNTAAFAVLTAVLYLLSVRNYPLFHSLAELFSIVIAFGLFVIAWNARSFFNNNYLLFVGIVYLYVAFFDLLHTLAYPGMGVFGGFDDNNLPPQLWLAARYLESAALLIAPLFFYRPLRLAPLFAVLSALSVFLIWAIFIGQVFPVCFVTGTGLTPFKQYSEYLVVAVLLAALVLLYREKERFDPAVVRLLTLSVGCTIITELCFTLYIDLYGLSNFVGHIFKILSFYFMYKAIIETSLKQPYSLLFRELKQSEEVLRRKEASLVLAQRLAGMGSWEWQLDSGRMWWSDEMYRIFDYDPDLTEPSISLIVARTHPDDRETVQLRIDEFVRDRKPFKHLHRVLHRSGEVRHVCAQVTEGKPETPDTTVGIVHDITEQVLAEEMRTDIELITRHDLKTPLSPVLSIPDLLLEDDNLTPVQRDHLCFIRESGFRMLAIIDSSLSLYKMEKGVYELSPAPFDLLLLLRAVIRESQSLLERRRVSIDPLLEGRPAAPDDLFMVHGEEMLCYTMLANLLKNAIEASPQDGTVQVALRTEEDWSCLEICNAGLVPKEMRSRFFEKYATSGKKQGTGLGTYIAWLVVKTHGGEIELRMPEEHSTVVAVRLPRQKRDA